jgi:hypothetical protein
MVRKPVLATRISVTDPAELYGDLVAAFIAAGSRLQTLPSRAVRCSIALWHIGEK